MKGFSVEHGAAKRGRVSPEYRAWQQMKRRCYDAECDAYPFYGGRGVVVCDRWRESFEAFLADVGPRPSGGHSLDRWPNPNGNYEPGNVRWATRQEQMRNTRATHLVTHAGVTLCVREWASRIGLHETAFGRRLKNWGIERAITTPVNTNKRSRCKTAC